LQPTTSSGTPAEPLPDVDVDFDLDLDILIPEIFSRAT
jgi:hypothetical protein